MKHEETPDEPTQECLLFLAVQTGNLDQTFDLIKAGADLSACDWWGWTPLPYAETPEMAELLIELGADPDQIDDKGTSVWKTASSEICRVIELAQSNREADALTAATVPVHRSRSIRF